MVGKVPSRGSSLELALLGLVEGSTFTYGLSIVAEEHQA